MTISTTRTRNPTVAGIVRSAYRRAGLLNEAQELSEERARVGREELDDLIEYLATEGVAAKSQTTELVTLVSGTRDYTLSAVVLDVRDNGAYIAPGESLARANAETMVLPLTVQEFQNLGAKDATGTPFRYYVDRSGEDIVVTFWPTPGDTEAGGSVRFIIERLRADVMNGNATIDMERYWVECVKIGLAKRLAQSNSLNPSRINQLGMDFAEALAKCRSKASPQVPTSFRVGHRTPWSR